MMPARGNLFTSQSPFFPIFIMSVVSVTPQEQSIAYSWFKVVVVEGSARSVSWISRSAFATLYNLGLTIDRVYHLFGKQSRISGVGYENPSSRTMSMSRSRSRKDMHGGNKWLTTSTEMRVCWVYLDAWRNWLFWTSPCHVNLCSILSAVAGALVLILPISVCCCNTYSILDGHAHITIVVIKVQIYLVMSLAQSRHATCTLIPQWPPWSPCSPLL